MPKRTEIISKILSSLSNLEPSEAKTLFEISKDSGIHQDTVKSHIQELNLIQDFPRIEVIATKSSTIVRLKEEKDFNYIAKKLEKIEQKIERLLGKKK